MPLRISVSAQQKIPRKQQSTVAVTSHRVLISATESTFAIRQGTLWPRQCLASRRNSTSPSSPLPYLQPSLHAGVFIFFKSTLEVLAPHRGINTTPAGLFSNPAAESYIVLVSHELRICIDNRAARSKLVLNSASRAQALPSCS